MTTKSYKYLVATYKGINKSGLIKKSGVTVRIMRVFSNRS